MNIKNIEDPCVKFERKRSDLQGRQNGMIQSRSYYLYYRESRRQAYENIDDMRDGDEQGDHKRMKSTEIEASTRRQWGDLRNEQLSEHGGSSGVMQWTVAS